MRNNYVVIVQASSISWSGGRDYCMVVVENHPVVYWTVKRVFDTIPASEVIIAAPSFDRGGLEFLKQSFPKNKISVFYGHDASPLNRILDACSDMRDVDYIIRVDGIHFCFDPIAAMKMLAQAQEYKLDCVKMPDDFPVAFTSEIYRVGAMRTLDKLLTSDMHAIFRVHPKFFMFKEKDLFHCQYIQDIPQYSDTLFQECRNRTEPIFSIPRMEVQESKKIWTGDQLSFHYELALTYLEPAMKTLDIACGDGFGVRIFSQKLKEIHGADIDAEIIAEAKRRTHAPNVSFHVEDVTGMSYGSAEFDAITSMETFEHVDPLAYLKEVSRVLKPGGVLIMSTPQNSMGHIPITSCHVHEYSLDEVVNLCSQYFDIKHIIGIKAGRIIVPGDPKGTNTMLVCINKKENIQ